MSRLSAAWFLSLLCLLSAGEAWAVQGNELSVSSPFFKPYEGDFSIELGAAYKVQENRLTIPALDSSRENTINELASAIALTYGVTEYFSLGISGKYMVQQDNSLRQSGPAFAGNPGSESRNQGFYDPGFQLGFRMLGTRTEEYFLNLDLGYVPGIIDSNNLLFSWPHHQFLAGITVGRDFGTWSIGIFSSAQYYNPSDLDKTDEKNNQLLSSNQLIVQADLEVIYVRLSGGAVKFLDSRSNENDLKKRTFPTAGLEIGFPVTETFAVSTKLAYVSGAQGVLNISGFSATLVAQPIWVGSVSAVVAF